MHEIEEERSMNERWLYAHLALLARNGVWLILAGLVSALVALAALLSQPRTYLASVDVVPSRARTVVNLDTKFQTVSEATALQGRSADGQPLVGVTTASAERRQALARLVRSPDIALAVRDELKDELPPEYRDLRQLVGAVTGAVLPRTEMISITVEAPSAAVAEKIALAWARAYERHVNTLYASSQLGTTQLEAELNRVTAGYEAAEGALTRFEGASRLEEYKRQVETKSETLKHLSEEALQEKAKRLGALYAAAQRIDLLTADAEALLQQIEAAPPPGGLASTEVALTLLKAQAFASSAPLPGNLQLQLPASGTPSASGDPRADAASLVQTLRSWKGGVGREIRSRLLELRLPEGATEEEALTTLAAGGAGDDDLQRVRQIVQASSDRDLAAAVARVEQDVRQLNGAVADLTAQQKRLQEQRDVARDVYFGLLKKTEEARLSAAVANGQEVTVASRAVVAEPRPLRLPLILSLAAVLGAAAGAVVVLLREWSVGMRRGLAWTPPEVGGGRQPEDATLRTVP